ncbi:hypothetical protein [Photobacterium damselae]|uniref:hypothetical protein n=1 Tax=Photobacterium damselae TaxID=38293 RepID=UPI00165D6CB6|nr:hypothetical protein [Photobacterium damselae]
MNKSDMFKDTILPLWDDGEELHEVKKIKKEYYSTLVDLIEISSKLDVYIYVRSFPSNLID